ncbi:MAG: hypothetical protein AAGD06_21780 [Acidobacteriota bacterium]
MQIRAGDERRPKLWPAVAGLLAVGLLTAAAATAQMGSNGPEYDKRVAEALRELDVKYSVDKDGDFEILFEMDGDRTQLAWIISDTNEYRNFEIREIWSYGYKVEDGELPADVARKILEDSFQKKLGAWGYNDGYAVYVTRIAADADAESLYSALMITLDAADEMEQALLGDKDDL